MIEIIVIDVDGTLTDGKIYYTNSGEEMKGFNIRDGLMIKSWNLLGKKSVILTGRTSKIVEKRAKELDITLIKQGIRDKKREMDKILEEWGYNYSNVAFIGDDMNDYLLLKRVKSSFCPFDANPLVQDLVKYRLHKNGGEGCVAEMIEILLKKEKLEEEFLKLWT
jgi:3-deoxy-D-manno-octulosonate 8-phosphate phosphatase (KDO 8-P phosphatase)